MQHIAGALLVLLALTGDSASREGPEPRELARHVYPLAKPLAAPKVVLDASAVPAARAWGEIARQLVADWYSVVTSLLATESFDAPKQIRVVIVETMTVPASTSGNVISVNAQWIAAHPEDFGMVVHELVHVVQGYPDGGGGHGWLVEGIADYVRWWRYEPEQSRHVHASGQSWRDGYRTTAAFLAWAMRTHDMRLVVALDRALRLGQDPARAFESVTGRTIERAWDEYARAPR